MSRPARSDGGSAIVEMVIMMVVFFGFIAAVVFAGRVTTGRARVEAAARSAARTISIARDPEGAVSRAETQAADMVARGDEICATMTFEPRIDRTQDPGVVTVEITCTTDLSELSLIELPATLPPYTVTATEVLDRYREHA